MHEHAVLLVDDQAENREAIGLVLAEEGCAVRLARDGQEALDALHEGLRPCLVVVDLMMPRMDGWEFRQRQLTNPQFRDIPVLVMSGYPDTQKVAAGLGVREVLHKPITPSLLLALVNANCPYTAAVDKRA